MRHPVTYCTNIHPAESWPEIVANVESRAPAVKAACCPDRPFPLGLRVSGRASAEIDAAEAMRFHGWLRDNGFYVATINGFPYGAFHGRPVKRDVYQPDWRDPERAAYTIRLADLLARWLPEGMRGSISSVPVAFGPELSDHDMTLALENLDGALTHLALIRERVGKHIFLSLEPEPGCLLETSSGFAAFYAGLALPSDIKAHLACCYDCCHQALQFEDPAESLNLLRKAGVPIGNVQVSSALHLSGADVGCLARYNEPTYLHQAAALTPRGPARYDDLPDAMADPPADAEAWRVHFHLPVFLAELPECRSTRDFLADILPLFDADTPLEVETYTWSVLPDDLKTATVEESIIREIAWVEGARGGR